MGWEQALGPAAAVVGGVLNYNEAQKAAGARGDDLERIRNIVNAIKNPEFDVRYLAPEDYQLAAKYSPALAEYIAQKAPQLVTAQSEGAVQGRAAEMDALSKFRNLSQTGEDVQSQILRENALNAAARRNAAEQGALRSRFQQQGRGGSAMDYVSSLMAQQGGAQQANQSAQQAAMDAYNTRLQAARDSANLGGNIRQADVSLETQNANAINKYNADMANSYQDFLNSRADTMNKANLFNIGEAQKISNANVAQKNVARQGYQDTRNRQAQDQFGNALKKVGLQTGSLEADIANTNQNYEGTTKGISGIFGGLSKAGGAYAQDQNDQSDYEAFKKWKASQSA